MSPKHPRCPQIFILFLGLLSFSAKAQYNFTSSALKGVTLDNPTSIQFGPDKRLYVSQQNGVIKAFTIKRTTANDYAVSATETINLINQIPNHDDDGSLNTTVTTRQVTGIVVKGTASNPILYVSSSDSRIGGGGKAETNLDTNSGIISELTWNGTAWVKIDLVRGLPRSEENHAVNGMQLDEKTNTLYLAVGGHTNAGSPSNNFNFTCEYVLSAAILSINLTAIKALPNQGNGASVYKYDLPTLDDPSRNNNPDGSDVNDPFGGDDGLNMARIVTGGPVQIYSPGWRNPFDLVITKSRKMYAIDNGANQGWGGYPANEGTASVTNQYVSGEPGSTTPTATEATVNNLDNLHYIGNIDTYTPGSFYAGHPNPIRANPAGAGLYVHDGTTGVWRNSTTGANPLPTNWPPVDVANPVEGDFKMPGTADGALLTFSSSTNGIAEYTASNFNNALKGSLLAASWEGGIVKISLTADGTNTTNSKSSTTKLNQEPSFASNFGSQPLDVTTQGDNEIFPGTVWAATYGANAVVVFEPQDFLNCSGADNASDEDGDGYTNADEIDNSTNACSASSKPSDFDQDFVSDLNDLDDDNDGINDTVDEFALDAQNGRATNLPISYNLFNNDPGTGLFGVGFTGLMSNKANDYRILYNDQNLIAGGAVGAFTVVNVSAGDALGSLNTQENGFQFGLRTNGLPFTVRSRMTGPFFNSQTPQGSQSQGIYIGNGDQDNYLKIVLNANGGVGGIQVVYENAGAATNNQYSILGGIPNSLLDLFLKFDPVTNTVQASYSANDGVQANVGSPIAVSGALLKALQGASTLAVGVISTSRGGAAFTATWDYIFVNQDATTSTGSWQTLTPTAGTIVGREENAYVQAGNKFYLMGGRGISPVQEYDPIAKTWTSKASPPVELNHFQAVTLDGMVYAAAAFNGAYPHEVPVPNVYIYNPASDQWKKGVSIPQARRRGSAGTVVYNNKVYMVGGITDGHWAGWVKWFDEYDPATNTWKTLPDAPRERDHAQAAVINGKLYVAGGRRSSASTSQTFSLTVAEVDVYDFATSTWSTLPSTGNIPTQRAGTSNVVLGNELLVIGGESTQPAAHKETEALNVTTKTWRRLADLQQGRHGTQAIVNNGGVFTATGAGNQGGSPLLTSQESFYFYSPTTPDGASLTQSQLAASTAVNFGTVDLSTQSTKTLTLFNKNGNQGILVSSVVISGASSFTFSSPIAVPFVIPVGGSVSITVKFSPTASGAQSGLLIVNHSGLNGSTTTSLSGDGGSGVVVYRVNSGGSEVTNSIGTFAADANYSPAPGSTYSNTKDISNTTNDAIYQTERFGTSFGYGFPVNNGQYKVVLHFAEIYYTTSASRIFDVSIEGNKVLDNYDIVAKAGPLNATTETFNVNVTDGVLNINFSSATADGGKNNAKVSAVEIITVPPPPVGQAISSFTLVNADNEQDIQTLANGAALNLAQLPTRNLNIRANTSPATVGSVVFNLSGTQTRNQTETGAPYTLFGDNSGNYLSWTPAVGSYTLKATPFTASGGTGTAGTTLTVSFTVNDQSATNKPPVANAGADKTVTLPTNSVVLSGSGTDADGTITAYTWSQVSGPNTAAFNSKTVATPTVGNLVQGSYVFGLIVTDNQNLASTVDQVTVTVKASVASFTLVNADNEQDIQTLANGAALNLAQLPTRNLNIRANTSPATVGSVVFNLSGTQTRQETDNKTPYALFGDRKGKYSSWTPAVGSYTLKATPFTASGGTGTAGVSNTIDFSIINQAALTTTVENKVAINEQTATVGNLKITAYPNPSPTGRFKVVLSSVLQGELTYTLLAPSGADMASGKMYLASPSSTLDFDFSKQTIASGVYYLQIKYKHEKATLKLSRVNNQKN